MDLQARLSQEDYENKPVWFVKLNNGEEFYSNDLYIDDKSDWLRLKEYCVLNNYYINSFQIRFRDRVIQIPESSKYFFRRMEFCALGGKNSNKSYFVIGYEKDNKIYISKYMIPELEIWESEYRDLENCEESIINGQV